MAAYMYVIVLTVTIHGVVTQTTKNVVLEGNKTFKNVLQTDRAEDTSSSSKGLGTTGLVILLVAVAFLFVVFVIVALFLIHRHKKKQLEIRANRASYINCGYEETGIERFVQNSERGSQKSGTLPPIKPTRRSSSKKGQNISYENVEIGLNKQFSVESLPRSANNIATLMVPNLTAKTSSMGSSIPYIDASKENLDEISEKGKNSTENVDEISEKGKNSTENVDEISEKGKNST